MSEIAGVVSRTRNPVGLEELTGMLKRLAPPLEHSLETARLHGERAVLGRVSFAPDPSPWTASRDPRIPLRAFWTGELYRDEEDDANDTEHLMQAFARRGWERFARDLHGSFAIAIAEEGPGSAVTLVTDHTASCPIFLLERDDRVYFASNARAFLGMGLAPDPDSAYALLARTCFSAGRTLLRGVRQLDYATACRIENGRLDCRPYWRYAVRPTSQASEAELREDLADRVRRAVRRRTRSGRGVVLLSGGVDSRAIAACIEPPDRVTAATYSPFPEAQRPAGGDWSVARAVAERLGMPFHTVQHDPWRWDRVLEDSVRESAGASGFVYQNEVWGRLRRDLGAEYAIQGDECMGSGEGPLSARQALCWEQIWPRESYERVAAVLAPHRRDDFLDAMHEEYEATKAQYAGAHPNDFVDELYFRHRLLFVVQPKRRLLASHGVHPRSPLLDREILDRVQSLPARYRVRKALFRRVVRDLHPELWKLPRARVLEVADYAPIVRRSQVRDGALTRLLADPSGWMGEFFDPAGMDAAIRAATAPPPGPSAKQRLAAWLPVGTYLWLKGSLRKWVDPTPHLAASEVALRLATVAAALRGLEARGAAAPVPEAAAAPAVPRAA